MRLKFCLFIISTILLQNCGIPEVDEALKNPQKFKAQLENCAGLKVLEGATKIYQLNLGYEQTQAALAAEDLEGLDEAISDTKTQLSETSELFLLLKFTSECESLESIMAKMVETSLQEQLEADLNSQVAAAATASAETADTGDQVAKNSARTMSSIGK